MHQLCFDLAGLRLRICSDIPLSVSNSFTPFLAETDAPGQDLLLRVEREQTLPTVPEGAFTSGGVTYYQEDGCLVSIHWDQSRPVCRTQLGEKTGKITYLPGYAHWVSGTVGLFNRIGLESLLLSRDVLLLHAALVRWNDVGILLTGPSGVGKSTQARLWQSHLGARILNGDRAALRCLDGSWQAWGLPFAGTSHIFCNEQAPIGALVVLRQAKKNRLQRLTAREAFGYVFPELSLRRWEENQVDRALRQFLLLAEAVPIYLLECLPDSAAAELVCKQLKREFSL